MVVRGQFARIARGAAVTAVVLLAGCVTTVPQRPLPPPAPPARVAPPDTTVYAAPTRGQTPQQQDRDHYECAQWATQQTGFDPSRPLPAPAQPGRIRVVPSGPAPGSGVLAGAATGAIIGAAVSNPWHQGPGALIGMVAGAMLGGAAETAQNNQAQQVAAQANAEAASSAQYARDANVDAQAANYRRALGACLDARGYSVR